MGTTVPGSLLLASTCGASPSPSPSSSQPPLAQDLKLLTTKMGRSSRTMVDTGTASMGMVCHVVLKSDGGAPPIGAVVICILICGLPIVRINQVAERKKT